VQHRESAPDVGVAQAGEPSRLLVRHRFEVAPDRLDEHELAQAREHRLAARPLVARFRERDLHEVAEPPARRPVPVAHVQEPRQRRDERIERTDVAAEETADEVRALGAAAARLHRHRQLRPGRRRVVLEPRGRQHPGRARHHVRVAGREDDHVTRLEEDGRLADQASEAAALDDDVVRDQVLDAGQHRRRDHLAGRRLLHPRRRRLDVEEDGARQPHRAQNLGERVATHDVFLGSETRFGEDSSPVPRARQGAGLCRPGRGIWERAERCAR